MHTYPRIMTHIGDRRVEHYCLQTGLWHSLRLSPYNSIMVYEGDPVFIRVRDVEDCPGLDKDVHSMRDRLLTNFRFHNDPPLKSGRRMEKRRIDTDDVIDLTTQAETSSRTTKKRKISTNDDMIDLTTQGESSTRRTKKRRINTNDDIIDLTID